MKQKTAISPLVYTIEFPVCEPRSWCDSSSLYQCSSVTWLSFYPDNWTPQRSICIAPPPPLNLPELLSHNQTHLLNTQSNFRLSSVISLVSTWGTKCLFHESDRLSNNGHYAIPQLPPMYENSRATRAGLVSGLILRFPSRQGLLCFVIISLGYLTSGGNDDVFSNRSRQTYQSWHIKVQSYHLSRDKKHYLWPMRNEMLNLFIEVGEIRTS